MNKERELLRRALEALHGCSVSDAFNLRAEIRTCLASKPESDKPVAWVDVKETDQGPYEFHGIKLLPIGKHNLYTRPAPERKPLSDEGIADIYYSGIVFEDNYLAAFTKGFRQAEKYHDIGRNDD